MGPSAIPVLISLMIIVVDLWMFFDMIYNPRIVRDQKWLWSLGFLILSLPTAVYYYFTHYRR